MLAARASSTIAMIKAQQRTRIEILALGAVFVLGLSACGGGSTSSSSHSASASTSKTNSVATSTAPAGGGAMDAVLTGQNHAPKATKPWFYTVRVTSAQGKPLTGTVETEFAFGGQVVGRESPPTHQLKNGVLKDEVEFPKQAIGQPIALQVVVHTSAGSKTLDWPVHVQP
jgi:hypothetical protein